MDFEIIGEIEKLTEQLFEIKETLSLLNFWDEYPEIKSITLFGEEEFSDGNSYITPRITDIKFVKENGLVDLLSRLDCLEDYPDDSPEPSDWNDILFEDDDLLVNLEKDIKATYSRPKRLEHKYFSAHVNLIKSLSNLLSYTADYTDWKADD